MVYRPSAVDVRAREAKSNLRAFMFAACDAPFDVELARARPARLSITLTMRAVTMPPIVFHAAPRYACGYWSKKYLHHTSSRRVRIQLRNFAPKLVYSAIVCCSIKSNALTPS